MEVQDKINELVEKFSQQIKPCMGSGMVSYPHDDETLLQAKQCALITVDEVLANTSMYIGNLNPKWKFWNDVKQELEKEASLKTGYFKSLN